MAYERGGRTWVPNDNTLKSKAYLQSIVLNVDRLSAHPTQHAG